MEGEGSLATRGWLDSPSVAVQDLPYHRIGPLRPEPNEKPCFAKIYIHNPQHDVEEATIRLGWMRLPLDISVAKQRSLHELLRRLQALLRQCNPYIQDFLAIGEIPEEQVEQQKMVIMLMHDQVNNMPAPSAT